ncbi:MAG: FkbM family methyltransferase [Pyrinomonadaceae bacterium]
MGDLSQKLARARRVPARLTRDAWLIRNLENWREALAAEWRRTSLSQLKLRNGIVLNGPDTIDLAFLFHETWQRRIYSPAGYEIGPGESVIDIGANIGVFATFAATQAPGVRVFSFEPFPENVKWLRDNVNNSALTNVQVFQQAVSAKTGVRYLDVNVDNWIVHSLFAEGTATQTGLPVDSVSFDDIMNREDIDRCDLLKLDCEGSEYEILQYCAPETLKRVRRIVGEYHEGPHINGTGEELCRFLESRSFRIDNFDRGDGCGVFSAYNLHF